MNAAKPQIWRLAQIDAQVRASGSASAAELAERMEVSLRTVYRDVEFLRDRFGAPIEYDAGRRAYVYTENSWQMPAVLLTEGELVALFLAERTLAQYRGTPYERDIRHAFEKIVRLLPDAVSIHLGELDSFYSCRSSATSVQDIERFRLLVRATMTRTRLAVLYRSVRSDQPTERLLDPYHLSNVDGEWYLFAHCHLRGGVRVFRPDRVLRATVTTERFTRPADFNPNVHFEGSLAIYSEDRKPRRAVLEFDTFAGRYICEKVWHPTQQLTVRRDGKVRLELKLTSFVELERFALSWGAHCRALHPASLVRALHEEHVKAARAYNAKEER